MKLTQICHSFIGVASAATIINQQAHSTLSPGQVDTVAAARVTNAPGLPWFLLSRDGDQDDEEFDRRAESSVSSISRVSPDAWQCATKNMTQYFQPPRPGSTLLSQLYSYGNSLRQHTCTVTAWDWKVKCPGVNAPDWCGFSTVVSATAAKEYSSFGSSISSWSASRSNSLSALPSECPQTWNKAKHVDGGDGEWWLNTTLAWIDCYNKANPKTKFTDEMA